MTALPQSTRDAIRVGLAQGLTRKDIARAAGVSVATVFKYGAGIERPRFAPPYKQCVCGKTFYPTARTQAPGRWRRRLYCSRTCAGRHAKGAPNATAS